MVKRCYHKLLSIIKGILKIRFAIILKLLVVQSLMLRDGIGGKKILIIFLEEPGFAQYILPILKALKKKDPPISYYVATDYASFASKFGELNVGKNRMFPTGILAWLWLAHMFLSASVSGNGPRHAIRINISHNLPVKVECYPKKAVSNYDVHFLTGPLQRSQYKNMFKKYGIEIGKIRMLEIGYPKSDALLQGAYKRDGVLRGLGLNPKDPTILYAPAWDPGGSLRCFGVEVIEKLLGIKGINVIVKLHPISYTSETSPHFEFYTGGINWVERFLRFERYPNFRHVSEYSIDPLLAASDIMITDFSSAALEYIMIDRPVIYLDCPEYFEKTLRRPEWNTDPEYARNDSKANAGRHVGLVVEELSQLIDAVKKSIYQPEELSAKRKELSKELLYNPGKGAETAANAIMELLDQRN